jgi:hypothetical protein
MDEVRCQRCGAPERPAQPIGPVVVFVGNRKRVLWLCCDCAAKPGLGEITEQLAAARGVPYPGVGEPPAKPPC